MGFGDFATHDYTPYKIETSQYYGDEIHKLKVKVRAKTIIINWR
jgi:hypothetical protein